MVTWLFRNVNNSLHPFLLILQLTLLQLPGNIMSTDSSLSVCLLSALENSCKLVRNDFTKFMLTLSQYIICICVYYSFYHIDY